MILLTRLGLVRGALAGWRSWGLGETQREISGCRETLEREMTGCKERHNVLDQRSLPVVAFEGLGRHDIVNVTVLMRPPQQPQF